MLERFTLKAAIIGCVALGALSACTGADNVASPGEGFLVSPPPPPAPPPPPPPPTAPPPTAGPAADCPVGFANVGTINNLRNCQISGNIIGNRVIPKRDGTIYSISGRLNVGLDLGPNPTAPLPAGQQGILTIEPGVTIFGSAGLDFIVVNRGSQMFAEGSATQPIIMTSRQNIEGTTGPNSIGQWGGLVVLGRAPTAAGCPPAVDAPNIACESQVEGTNALYGGNSPGDNSGRFRYLQVRYAGFEVLPDNELNGITYAGVGDSTNIEYVQVHNGSDDGIEMFGGTANLRHIVVTGADDDSYDTDTGFSGAAQFMIIVQREGGGDRGFEMSSAGSKTLLSFPKVANLTMVARVAGSSDAIIINSDTRLALVNSVVTRGAGAVGSCLRIDGAGTQTQNTAPLNTPFNSVYFSCPTPFSNSASSIGAAAIAAIFNAGANNISNGTSTLTDTFINGANETARPVTDSAAIDDFFTATTYIGAVRDASDTWWTGWTCGLPNQPAC